MVPVADQNYEIWNCPIFCYMIIRGKSKLWINIKHSLLKINLHEQQACTFVKFSDIAKNWPFVTLIPVDPPIKNFWYTKNYPKKLDQWFGRIWKIWKWENTTAHLTNSCRDYIADKLPKRVKHYPINQSINRDNNIVKLVITDSKTRYNRLYKISFNGFKWSL